ncbi:TetR/AcrR family transcriptional regulator [Tepidamorphus sp. 3E244]|uniref:TetR/AcrR family transcriptional regulator n=1 Tax=Tepidamorphus sp. 3E244 TaxID=3385498 RepID=UPI0038FCA80E
MSSPNETPNKADLADSIVDGAMRLAERQPWSSVRLSDIAAEAGVTLSQMRGVFDSKSAVLGGFVRRIDQAVLDGNDPEMADEPARDRLFDVLMRRFEAMKPYRAALRSIAKAYRRDPLAIAGFNAQARRSMTWMLESAGIGTTGRMGTIRAQGLVFVMARTLPVFLRDRDEGLARTMAALDRALRDGEQVMRSMGSGFRLAGMVGSVIAGLRERARAEYDDANYDDPYGEPRDGDDPYGEADERDEPWTGGPH